MYVELVYDGSENGTWEGNRESSILCQHVLEKGAM